MTLSPVGAQPHEWGCLDYFTLPYEEASIQFSMFSNWQSSNLESIPFPISNAVHLVLFATLVIPIINTITLLALHALGIARAELDDSLPLEEVPPGEESPAELGGSLPLEEVPPEEESPAELGGSLPLEEVRPGEESSGSSGGVRIGFLQRLFLTWFSPAGSDEKVYQAKGKIIRWIRGDHSQPLNLSLLNLRSLPPFIVSPIREVTHLNLSGNQLQQLPVGFFESLPNLQEVDFRDHTGTLDLNSIAHSLQVRGVTVYL